MIKSIGYDGNSETLEVEFSRGDVYQYYEVPENFHSDVMSSESIGREFGSVIMKGGFKFKRMN
tara:strand:- start:350 stop:538 length:189 start_codon:yes stop_codon:yes gene_type:complete